MATNVGSVSMDLILNSSKFKGGITSSSKMAEGAFSSSMKKVGGFIASAFSIVAITKFAKASVDAASQMQSAWTGLKSIADGSGKSFSTAQKYISEYTKDGLISINEAATAYKNLLSRGYDTTQIEKTMSALKDSAAFGRQASYSLGEAVVTATEGLKNENSILVDNAGVTKNVAKMWEEWAKAHNTTTNAMTQAQKIEAEYNGILTETRFQTGDAITYTKTFGGQVQTLKAAFTGLKVAVGSVVAPIAGLFIPVINSALVAVTNFFNGLKQVLTVFGLSFPSVVSKASSGITNLGKNAINTAGDIASTGTAAKKAAKEVNKAFSNVDEINVLNNTKDSGSNGSGGPSTGTDVAVTPTIASDDAVTTAVSGTMSKIMKFIEPLRNIKFDNLINAFSNLKSSIEPVIQTIGDIIGWLYFNILVPFAKWTIEDAIPAFFNALSGAFKVLNPVLIAFKDLGIWLWDSFLQPIASWTGGIIVSVLNGIGDGLSKIGNWMSANQPVVDAITFSIVGFFGAWEVMKLMSFIEQSGGVIAVLKNMGTALWTVTGAKIKDMAETVALTAMYAGDFIKNIAMGTANLIKQGIQWGITTAAKIADTAATIASTVATTAATVATWAFNAALAVLTSPITLVVVAIGALIAIIVLCVKHWDEIKSACGVAMETIKNVVQVGVEKVKAFFTGIIDFVKSNWQGILLFIVNPFAGAFKLLYDNCEGFRNTINNLLESVKNAFSSAFNAIKNTISTIWDSILGLFSKGGRIFTGVVDGIAGVFKTIVNTMISGINKVVSAPFRAINTALTKIKNIDILGAKPFKGLINTISIPQIPMLAQGDWVPANSPQLAVIGDNTREGEIVTPESKIYEQVKKALDEKGGSKQEIALTLYVKYEDGKEIIKKVNQAQIDAGEVLLLT